MARFADLPSDYPQELIDRIIDHCRDEHQDISQCSLVAKKWLPRTRYHLFSSLSIVPSPEDYHKLVLLLANPNCTIHLFIRELTLGAAFQARPISRMG
ncbi:hypothetical protein MPER_09478 [Moniliophthora perniciosa FA553]|nr:hypothetical protein MPER_09478 [Moniliophthora perniciosa FA553]